MSKIIKTAVTERLGIKYPIIAGGMAYISTPEFVAAVSEAGGMGILPSGTYTEAEQIRTDIRRVRELTDKPFAVNFTFMPSLNVANYEEYLRVCIEEGIKIIETSGRPAGPEMMSAMKGAGMTIIHKCTTAKHALKAQSIGCDMVVADGCECAGHSGMNDIGTIVLTPRCVEVLDIPVITAGGIATGAQMAAALVMGADGVYMGSRFLITKETPVLEKVKQYLVDNATETDTQYLMRAYRNTSRLYNSNVVKKALAIEQAGRPYEDMAELVSGKVSNKMFFENGDVENCGVITYGEVGGLIHSIMSVKEVIDSMISGCIEALGKFDA